MKNHGPWKIRSSRQIYRDAFVEVRGDDVIRPDQKDGHHVVVFMKPGVCVVPIDDQGSVYLTREFHYGIARDSLEGVSGGIEEGESILGTAQRELREELGIVAEQWIDLGSTDPFTTIVVSPTQMFLAKGLSFVENELEGTEVIQCVQLPFEDAVQKVLSGEITHSPTCIAILKSHLLMEPKNG